MLLALLVLLSMVVWALTLRGNARVALGTDLPALFCNDDDLARALAAEAGAAVTEGALPDDAEGSRNGPF